MAKFLTTFLPTTYLIRIDPAISRRAWAKYRQDNGRKSYQPLLTAPTDNHKLALSGKASYGLSLAQASLSGFNVCPKSTPTCRAGCVAKAGNGGFNSVVQGRILKTQFLLEHPEAFVSLLSDEIHKAKARKGDISVRLNVFSDLPWHQLTPWLFEVHSDVQFYDYTKVWDRIDQVPVNWHLTLSASERTSLADVIRATESGNNVAVVFDASRTQELPGALWNTEGPMAGYATIIDGDVSDDRPSDPRGVVVGLRAKGVMRRSIGKSAMIHTVNPL